MLRNFRRPPATVWIDTSSPTKLVASPAGARLPDYHLIGTLAGPRRYREQCWVGDTFVALPLQNRTDILADVIGLGLEERTAWRYAATGRSEAISTDRRVTAARWQEFRRVGEVQ